MEGFWIGLWSILWFAGLGIFSVLSVLVIVFGGRDLAFLFRDLKARHDSSQRGSGEA
jgi:hypothetical protein